MDFLLALNMNIAPLRGQLLGLSSSALDTQVVEASVGAMTYLATASPCSLQRRGGDIFLFDGQTTHRGQFHQSNYVHSPVAGIVEAACRAEGEISGGVFCAVNIATQADSGRAWARIATDWAGQYPVYFWQDGARKLVSNNIRMIETVSGASRNLLQGVLNLASMGGAWKATQLDGVERLDVGHSLAADSGGGLSILPRPDHAGPVPAYSDSIARAHAEIGAHIAAVAGALPDACYVTDLTGGVDSRTVLVLLQRFLGRPFRSRTLGRMPSPDANVAGHIIDLLGLQIADYPVPAAPPQFAIRQNATLSAGARESGAYVNPVGFGDLVHFKGLFGELGGGNAGADYINLALQSGPLVIGKALNTLFDWQRRVGILDALTPEAVEIAAQAEEATYSSLLQQGYSPETLFAERYIRVKARSHFGLFSHLSNKNHVSPDPLANRHIIQARRALGPAQYRHNKVLYDLMALGPDRSLLFAPMAGKTWDAAVVAEPDRPLWQSQTAVNGTTPALSDNVGALMRAVSIPFDAADRKDLLDLPLAPEDRGHATIPQFAQLAINRAFLRHFLTNIDASDEAWKLFDRNWVERSVQTPVDRLRTDGNDINAMGIAAAALAWKFGLSLDPKVQRHQRFRSLVG